MRRHDDVAVRLPNEVVELLASKGVPQTATAIRRTEGADMPLTTRGCQALADRMAAERRVYEEAQKLDEARGNAATIEDQGKEIAKLTDDSLDDLTDRLYDILTRLITDKSETTRRISGSYTLDLTCNQDMNAERFASELEAWSQRRTRSTEETP